ncbi:receptor-type tyrosine-protein phosphatase T-like [Amphiura filiformis]|uniref:receptor-type tyrosine-protein phosphatase T-like n=1 Tax=Amphiura filiformis TaxID=82378 RepID=UPI003B21FBF5
MTLYISWEASDTGCITDKYLVRITLIYQDQCSSTSINIRESETMAPSWSQMGLMPYSTYMVEITPVNSVGSGAPIAVNVITSDKAPTLSPSNLRLENQGTCHLQFNWDNLPCGSRGGEITYVYEIYDIINQTTQSGTASTNTAMIDDLDCLGNYQVRVKAQNSVGGGQWSDYQNGSTVLQGISVSALPRSNLATELMVTWGDSTAGCSCSVMYLLEYTLINPGQCGNRDDGVRMNAGTTSGNSYTLTGLSPYSTYTVYVTPMVGGRQGDEVSATDTTLQSVLTSGPVVSVTERTKSSIYFTWEEIPCESRGGSIMSYNVILTDMNNGNMFQMSFGPNELSVNITELEPDHEYTFRISARNGLGEGPATERTEKTLPLGPNPPGSVILQASDVNSLTFSWDEATCDGLDGCSSIIGYSYKLVQASDVNGETQGNISDTMVTINELLPCAVYEFYVAATSDLGFTGPYSNAVSAQTAMIVPSSVNNIARSADTNSYVLVVTWTEPEGHCPAESYRVGYQLLNKDMCDAPNEAVTGSVDVLDTRAEISSLEPYSEYMVTVNARNNAGLGPDQSATVMTGEQAPSAAPPNVRNTTVSVTSANFIWDEVTCGHRRGNIFQYHCMITSTADSADNEEQYTFERNASYERLQPCTTYDFTVAAVTVADTGPRSIAARITTEKTKPSPISNLMALPLDRSTMPLVSPRVQWTPSTSSPCQAEEYLVEYLLLNIDQCDLVSDSATEMYATVTDTEITLTGSSFLPHSTYRVYVTAKNSGGAAGFKNIDIQTEDAEPTGAPLSVEVTDVGQRHLTFSWIEPDCGKRNGDIVMYSYELTDHRTNSVVMDNTSDTTVSIKNLTPYVGYSFSVAAVNSASRGPFSNDIVRQTEEDVPPAPEEVIAPNTDTESITIQWLEPDPPHGVVIIYHIQYWKTSESMTTAMSAMNESTAFTLSGLQANTNYSFRVQAETSAGRGEWSTTIIAITEERPPGKPADLQGYRDSEYSIRLEWNEPVNTNGVIRGYTIEYKASEKLHDPQFLSDNMYASKSVKGDVHQYLIEGLEPSTKYEFRVSGSTSGGQGEEAVVEVFTAAYKFRESDAPAKPNVDKSGAVKFDDLNQYASNAYVSVEEVEKTDRKRRTSEYTLYANLTRRDVDDNNSFKIGDNKTYGEYQNHVVLGGEDYMVRIQYASCTPVEKCSTTRWSNPTVFTAPTIGGNMKKEALSSVVPIVIIILVVILFVILVVVIVLKRDKIRNYTARSKTPSKDAQHDNPAFEGDIEDAKVPEESPPLNGDTDDDKKSSATDTIIDVAPVPNTPPVTPSVRRKTPTSRPSTPITPKPRRNIKPISVDRIKDHIDERTKDGSKGFKLEFNAIPGEKKKYAWDDAELEENVSSKNRFINILPYDHSRAKLQTGGDDPVANYINASIVTVYNGKTYIASQGPLEDTAADTWQLIWEQKSAKIIMVTNLVEKNKIKCDRYWPQEGPCKYGQFIVTPISAQKYADYTIRSFKLAPVGGHQGGMEIKQFHFTDWPDFGVPKYPTPVLNFIKTVNAFNPEGSGPPIIHCSAGVGRTGTYLTIDSMLEMAKEKGEVNVPKFVAQIRECRINMVQTAPQYQFIYESLYEALLVGETDISVNNLREEYAALSAKSKKGENKGKTGIEHQFQQLNDLTVIAQGIKGRGDDPENADKNRYPDKIPDASVRPGLVTPGGDENSTEYINAAYVDSRRRKDAFLVTQMPMPTTKGDIWRMVYDHNSYTIVMLNDMDTNDSTIVKYWPDESSSITVGPLLIEFQSSQKLDEVIVGRSFKITSSDEPNTTPRIVLQLQYLDWPAGRDVPNSAKTFMSLAALVHSHHEQNREKGPMTVHCMDGLGRTGMLCALLSMTECMKSDKMVDVFQEVKRLRMCRPGMVENATQYKFLFDVAMEYLDQSNYENFSPVGVSGNGESSETESTGGDFGHHVVMI